jgi:replicative DNA helicase
MEQVDFSKFGKDFQEKLVQLILEDRAFCDQIKEVLDIGFLELKHLQIFTRKVFEHKDKYNTHPSYKTVATILRTELEDENEATQQQIRSYFARIYKSDAGVESAEYIKEVSLDFCKKQKLKEAMMKSVNLLQRSSFDEISDIINNALKLGTDNNFGYDYLKDFEKRFELKSRNPVTTGWVELDNISKGGLGHGELGVVIAPTGAGKSMALVHLGTEALKAGKNVIHYTLELQDTVVAIRYDSCLTGVPLNDVYGFKDLVYEKVEELEGQLIVKEYPTKSASTNTIKNHLDKLHRRGIEVGAIIVDYADLLRPKTLNREKRIELESIYEELRAIAQEFSCPVWTASQTNRSGLNAEVITMESISEAFNKCFVADFIFSLSRTVEDKVTNTGRIFVAKNRNGPDGIIYPIYMDTGKVDIKVFKSEGETPSGIAAKTSKEQADLLKEKYKDFKKKERTKDAKEG